MHTCMHSSSALHSCPTPLTPIYPIGNEPWWWPMLPHWGGRCSRTLGKLPAYRWRYGGFTPLAHGPTSPILLLLPTTSTHPSSVSCSSFPLLFRSSATSNHPAVLARTSSANARPATHCYNPRPSSNKGWAKYQHSARPTPRCYSAGDTVLVIPVARPASVCYNPHPVANKEWAT